MSNPNGMWYKPCKSEDELPISKEELQAKLEFEAIQADICGEVHWAHLMRRAATELRKHYDH